MEYRQIKQFLKYQLFSKHKGGHGIHSPFVYQLLTEIIENKQVRKEYYLIEKLRHQLERNKSEIEVTDFGVGSLKNYKKTRTVSKIAKSSSVRPKYGQLLFRLIEYFQPNNILELGTSLGISTSYMSIAAPQAQIYSIEGCSNISKIANENFIQLQFKNINHYNSSFENILPSIFNELESIDFLFIDGNHQYEPTIQYFEQALRKKNNESIFIFDDIYWSLEMEQAWDYIKNHKEVSATINVFQFGIVFFRKEMQKQEFIIRF